MTEPRRIRITHIHREDACFGDIHWMGKAGTFRPTPTHYLSGYYSGFFRPDSGEPIEEMYFQGIRYRRI